jgi:hypothetical protein
VNQLRSEVHEVLGNRNMTDEKFQAVVLDEIAGLKVCGGWRHGFWDMWPCMHTVDVVLLQSCSASAASR